MRRIAVCCGMPRSGTTHVGQLLSRRLVLASRLPEETRFFTNNVVMENVKLLADLIYDQCLMDVGQQGRKYSAWGSKENFVTNFSTFMPVVINSTCERTYIERKNIDKEYVEVFESFMSTSLLENKTDHLIFKQPSAETYYINIDKMFPGNMPLYIYCMRDPYSIFRSMKKLGWVSGVGDFIQRFCDSVQSIEYLTSVSRAFIVDVDDKDVEDDDIVSLCSKFSGIPERPVGTIEEKTSKYWRNIHEGKYAYPDEEFFARHFYSSSAGDARKRLTEIYQKQKVIEK